MKKRLQKWLKLEINEEEIAEEIKDRVLFELSFIDRVALSKQDNSKLYHAHILYFLKKDSEKNIAYVCDRYYRANSKNEAYGAFCKLLEEKEVTPETVSCKWNPGVTEIDPDCFFDVREDA